MPSPEPLSSVYAALGIRRPDLRWSKLEIALGLTAVALGSLLDLPVAAAASLIVLGGYLALAGHRSHLYDAMTRQTAVLSRQRDSD